MDPILQVLLSWQFVLFGLAIAAIVYVLRLIVEYIFSALNKDLTQSKLWNNLIIRISPIFLGVVIAILLKKFPYPGFTPDANGVVLRGDRIIFGLVAGSLSTIMQNVVTSLLGDKISGILQDLLSKINPSLTPAVPVAPVPVASAAPVARPPVSTVSAPSVSAELPVSLPPRGTL
jgi:hypothetical protein